MLRILKSEVISSESASNEDEFEDFRPKSVHRIAMVTENINNEDGYFDDQYYFAYKYFPKAIGVHSTLVRTQKITQEMSEVMALAGVNIDGGTEVNVYEVQVTNKAPSEYYDEYDEYD